MKTLSLYVRIAVMGLFACRVGVTNAYCEEIRVLSVLAGEREVSFWVDRSQFEAVTNAIHLEDHEVKVDFGDLATRARLHAIESKKLPASIELHSMRMSLVRKREQIKEEDKIRAGPWVERWVVAFYFSHQEGVELPTPVVMLLDGTIAREH
jgi:hypothetical protein